jgi:hypothetical protein
MALHVSHCLTKCICMCVPDFYSICDLCIMVQDTIDGGKRGTRTQCVEAAQAALTAGAHCHI